MDTSSPFSLQHYPKSYGSMKPRDFRLKDFLTHSPEELQELSSQLYLFCDQTMDSHTPVTTFHNLPYLGSGWEWSVFQKDPNTVIKIPASIFSEVNDPRYLENSEYAYEMIKKYFPAEFVAASTFRRENNLNVIEQEFIEAASPFVPWPIHNPQLVAAFDTFLSSAQNMLEDMQWLPDFWFEKTENGIELNNVIVQKDTHLPKIIDFTFYFDPFRIYPQKTDQAVVGSKAQIEEFKALTRSS